VKIILIFSLREKNWWKNSLVSRNFFKEERKRSGQKDYENKY